MKVERSSTLCRAWTNQVAHESSSQPNITPQPKVGQKERGFIYIKVTDEEELEDAMKQFTTPETLMQPMLMEVFTDKEKDTTLLREYYHGLKNKPNE